MTSPDKENLATSNTTAVDAQAIQVATRYSGRDALLDAEAVAEDYSTGETDSSVDEEMATDTSQNVDANYS